MNKRKIMFKPLLIKLSKIENKNYKDEILFLSLNRTNFLNNSMKFFYKKKILKKKKSCIMLFKRRDYYVVFHIYIANKLIYVTNFEENSKNFKFHKFVEFYIFKIIKKLLYYKNVFNKIIFVLKFIKKVRKLKKKVNLFKKNDKNKIKYKRKKTHINGFFLRKLILCSSLLKKIEIKFLYNTSHSLAREKLKKKRRK